jgi:TonB family protein
MKTGTTINRAPGTCRANTLSALSVIGVVFVMMTTGSVAGAADDLATARELYASAAYEEALAALNRVRAAGAPAADAFAIEQYRAFCLLALGRGPEAQTSIEALVIADPLYRPSSEVSPRVRTAFSDVRRRLLPSIITQQYAKAKASFDRKDYAVAAAAFNQVLRVLADPEVAQLVGQPPLSDLKTLAIGFQELSTKAIPPPPLTAVAFVPATPAPVPAVPQPPRIYTTIDTRVVPPIPIRQDLPAFAGRLSESSTGALEVVVNEQGLVEAATMRESVNPAYDRLAVIATTNWRFRPATLDGVPVKFKKLISIAIK